MTLGDWDGLAPLAAAVALIVWAVLPERPPTPFVGADDRLMALEEAAAGQAVPWQDASSGQGGLLVPAGVFLGKDGLWCRSYRVTLDRNNDGTPAASARHTACRLGQGRWRERRSDTPVVAQNGPWHRLFQPSEQLAAVPE